MENSSMSEDVDFTMEKMVAAIIDELPESEVLSVFQNSQLSLECLFKWKDPSLNLSVVQLAILYKRTEVVKSLSNLCPFWLTDKFKYKWEDSDRQDEKSTSDSDDSYRLLNPPLHLACMVGCVEIVKHLVEKCSFYLNQVGYLSVGKRLLETNPKKMFYALPADQFKKGKPFELCVEEGQIDCVFYCLNNIVVQCFALRFLYAGLREPSSMLHKACSIGCGPLVKLVLNSSFKDVISLSDKNGKTPLHVAVWNGDTETIQSLLESGASVNVVTESKGCLHILYRSKLHPQNYLANTRMLIQYGVKVHLADNKGKTALHVLAEEIGISRIDVMKFWKRASDAICEMTSSKGQEMKNYTMEAYQNDLVQCLEDLLKKGMNPNLITTESGCRQTVLESLLQYSSLPYQQTTLWSSPEIVYKAVELLLSYGANPNMGRRCSDVPLFTYFIMSHVNDIKENDMKIKFIFLFILYGADVDFPAMKVNCYPFVAAVEKQLPIVVLESIANLMHLKHFNRAVVTIQERILPSLIYSDKPSDIVYAKQVVECVKKMKLRSLRHLCKVAILKMLSLPAVQIDKLPLPKFTKDYITGAVF